MKTIIINDKGRAVITELPQEIAKNLSISDEQNGEEYIYPIMTDKLVVWCDPSTDIWDIFTAVEHNTEMTTAEIINAIDEIGAYDIHDIGKII